MRVAACTQWRQGRAETDPLLDAPDDTRRGLTLLLRPPAALLPAIEALSQELRALEPAQYFYPAADLHLTVLSLISCYPGFTLADIDPAAYQALVAGVLRQVPPFRIELRGLTAAPGSILLQGFPQDEGLAALRAALRLKFRASGLQQTIDQRYSIQTAHATLVRFRTSLRHLARLAALVERYAAQFIGTFEVASMELVFNDWYQRASHTVLLEKYQLPA